MTKKQPPSLRRLKCEVVLAVVVVFLIPMIVRIVTIGFFRDFPSQPQWFDFVLAVFAIVLFYPLANYSYTIRFPHVTIPYYALCFCLIYYFYKRRKKRIEKDEQTLHQN